MNEEQRKGNNEELYEHQEQQGKSKELHNPMIYSGDTKDLSTLLSHTPSLAINDLLQKSYGQIWYGIEKVYRVCCR